MSIRLHVQISHVGSRRAISWFDFTHNANEEIAFPAGIPRLHREESQKRVGGVETNWIHGWRHAKAFAGSINRAVRYISHPAVPVRLSWISTLYLRGDAPRLTERKTLSGRPGAISLGGSPRFRKLYVSHGHRHRPCVRMDVPVFTTWGDPYSNDGLSAEEISSDIDLLCQPTCSSFGFRLGDLWANFLDDQILSCLVCVWEKC